jgi:hypothetical protein
VIPTAAEFPEVAREITEVPRVNHDDNQDTAVQALYVAQAPKPMNDGLYALEGILRALRPIMVPIEANDPRKYARMNLRDIYVSRQNLKYVVMCAVLELFERLERKITETIDGKGRVVEVAGMIVPPAGNWNLKEPYKRG